MKTQVHFRIIFLLIVVCLLFSGHAVLYGQISHGGVPRFHTPYLLKNSNSDDIFIEMPPLNVDSLIESDKLNESNMKGAFHFADKFYVNIEKGKDGKNYVLPDGTKVWQVGIRSKGAYSINVFFSAYHIPQGGRLFLYNSDKTHVIGSFTHENNSEEKILPVQPVAGDEIIVEYEEPAGVAFEGQLKISEVNHDYRGLLNYEPILEYSTYSCMWDILCVDTNNDNARSVVLLIIDGITACSGSLLNTTNNDGEPVFLTAVHCLNRSFQKDNVDFAKVAGTIVSFFNYNKPVCSLKMKASEEISLAGAVPLSIAVKNDMALLKFKDTPPDYYKPYYSGWNINPDAKNNYPFVNIHHPGGTVKKYGNANVALSLSTYEASFFNTQSHWIVSRWDVGATAGGSSGSALFDNQGLVVGGLTGGNSSCLEKKPDYFFALYKSWNYVPDVGNTLKNCLDPQNLGVLQYGGYDPYKSNPLIRLKNTDYNGTDVIDNSELSSPSSGLVFGHNSIGTREFAEEFVTGENTEIVGVYIIIPPVSLTGIPQVEIKVYGDKLSDENVIASKIFRPTYLDYDTASASFINKDKTMSTASIKFPTESFVKFSNEVRTGKKFYVSYHIQYPSSGNFSAYNVTFRSPRPNTAWLRDAGGNWFPATEHPNAPMSTALTIEPLIRHIVNANDSLPAQDETNKIIYLPVSRQLIVNTGNPDETGIIVIYSVEGRILDKIPYLGNNPVSLQSISQGNVVIVKVLSESGVITGKIVL